MVPVSNLSWLLIQLCAKQDSIKALTADDSTVIEKLLHIMAAMKSPQNRPDTPDNTTINKLFITIQRCVKKLQFTHVTPVSIQEGVEQLQAALNELQKEETDPENCYSQQNHIGGLPITFVREATRHILKLHPPSDFFWNKPAAYKGPVAAQVKLLEDSGYRVTVIHESVRQRVWERPQYVYGPSCELHIAKDRFENLLLPPQSRKLSSNEHGSPTC
jgi:hypothetical protein